MAVWSSFSRSLVEKSVFLNILRTPNSINCLKNGQIVRQMGGHGPKKFIVQPSRFQWDKFKDTFHYYVMIGLIPILGIVFYTNVFIGPAQLTETPTDYIPKHWEYHKHPITRFLSRYVYPSPQQEYEKMLHHLFEEREKQQLREIESKVRAKMAERNDYQAYYYRPVIAKYHRVSKEAADYLESIRGD